MIALATLAGGALAWVLTVAGFLFVMLAVMVPTGPMMTWPRAERLFEIGWHMIVVALALWLIVSVVGFFAVLAS